jgi:hypothetical protein
VSSRVRVTARWPVGAATHREADATGIGWCRRAAGRKSRSRARIGRSSGVPGRRNQVAEVGKRHRGFREARIPPATGRVNGNPDAGCSRGHAALPKGVDNPRRGGQAAARAQAGAGRSKGRCGAKVLARRKTPRAERTDASVSHGRPNRRTRWFPRCRGVRTPRPSGGHDRGVRGSARTRRGGKTTAFAVTRTKGAARRSGSS